MKNKIHKKLIEKISRDQTVRRIITRKSHLWFFLIFMNHYIKKGTPPFHYEIFKISEKTNNKLMVFMAFRGSGKSTIMNLSYTLWSILGVLQKKFVVIISNTQAQAKSHFCNIRKELENNRLLKSDLGPFKSEEGEWGQYSLEIPSMKAKIICVSKSDSIRGLLSETNRPDLIICDDLEDSVSVGSKEKRDALYRWFMSEVMTVGDSKTNIVVLGNLLHKDSLLMKLKTITENDPKGKIFRAYPLVDDYSNILWPQKYSAKEVLELRKSLPKNIWATEYALKILPDIISLLETQEEAIDLVKQLKCLPKWTIMDIIVGIRAGVLDKNWLEICKDCQNRKFQKPLTKEMEIYSISSPLIVKNQYSSVSECCLSHDMYSIGINQEHFNFLGERRTPYL